MSNLANKWQKSQEKLEAQYREGYKKDTRKVIPLKKSYRNNLLMFIPLTLFFVISMIEELLPAENRIMDTLMLVTFLVVSIAAIRYFYCIAKYRPELEDEMVKQNLLIAHRIELTGILLIFSTLALICVIGQFEISLKFNSFVIACLNGALWFSHFVVENALMLLIEADSKGEEESEDEDA